MLKSEKCKNAAVLYLAQRKTLHKKNTHTHTHREHRQRRRGGTFFIFEKKNESNTHTNTHNSQLWDGGSTQHSRHNRQLTDLVVMPSVCSVFPR